MVCAQFRLVPKNIKEFAPLVIMSSRFSFGVVIVRGKSAHLSSVRHLPVETCVDRAGTYGTINVTSCQTCQIHLVIANSVQQTLIDRTYEPF